MHYLGLRSFGLASLVFGIVSTVSVGQEEQAPKAATHMVGMRDGVKLATDVYLPDDGMGKYPVIVMRTPYNKNGSAGAGANAARRGYALVAQDMRGRFKSEGHHAIIFGNDGWGEHQDGKDSFSGARVVRSQI